MRSEASCTKTKLLIETLREEILAVAALRGTEFKYQDESDQYSIFASLVPKVFAARI